MDTRSKITEHALKYFNRHGFGAITLHQLAKEMGISRGNLTYHYKDKDALLESIAEDMWSLIETERSKSRQLPSFKNLHNEVQLYYQFQKKYAFIFLDTHVLNHPAIKSRFRKMTKQTIADNIASIAFSIKMGNMKPEPVKGMYHNVSMITWMLAFFWLPQQIIRGEKTNQDGERMIWSILIPHFTDKGLDSFKSFFGKEYYENLGDPFEVDLDSLISF
ncbi:MAG: TetR/AcrR family transcriptional regulator [Bacteroidetes bacterium]|nr:TetR/AcrR family transcriptional regulator [Bacteroidota bacterium]